jgi:hypothetical protein
MVSWRKNVAIQGFTFGMLNKVTGFPVVTGSVSGFITINGGSQAALTNQPTHEGNGQWSVDITAGEMNSEIIGLCFIHDDAIPCYCTIKTESGGSNTVAITVSDDSDVSIPDADIYIYDSSNTVFIDYGKTNSSGIFSCYLGDGTYKLRIRKSGVIFTQPETLVVSGDTESTITGEYVSVGVPEDSDACRVYDYCFDLAGQSPLATVTATAYMVSKPYHYDNKYHYIKTVDGTYDLATGLLYWDVVQGATVKFEITDVGLKKTVTIPAQSSVLLSSL